MSFDVVKTIHFPHAPFQHLPQEILDDAFEDLPVLGGILSDLKHVWQAKGSCLEIRNNVTARKVGSWVFGGILKDSTTRIVAIDEFKRTQGRLSFLIVGLECTISGGLVCVFDVFGSKVLRVIQIKEQITSLHVVDSTNTFIPEPSPLKFFDGLVAVGTLGGNVFLLDICQQICENASLSSDTITVRDELNPCQMVLLRKEKINSIKKYVEHAVEKEEHLAIHLNVVLNPSTEHFTLKGEKGEDRVHVNRSEAQVSSLFYSHQVASLLVGYNFGSFQLWDLRSLHLTYTSPICEEHIPVTHFTVQEPADDPKAYCYIWVSYSHDVKFHTGFPFAVMYSFYYDTKKYISDYGNIYDDFQHCSVRFQIELGEGGISTYKSRIRGGSCIGLQSLSKNPVNKDLNALSLCLISWFVWNTNRELSTSVLLFDLNQWYKEQMPSTPNWSECSNYIIKHNMPDQLYDVKLDQKSLDQFIGVQRLEEHFCPTSLSFDLWCLAEDHLLKIHNRGLQKTFIDKIQDDRHLSLIKPDDYFDSINNLGLVPLFCEINSNNSQDITYQREILLNVALEQKLIGWLCQCCSKVSNNAYEACGLNLFGFINWAFQRALVLKNHCDQYCISLFDYSGSKLDNNIIALLSSSTSQIKDICTIYRHISNNLQSFLSDKETLLEEQQSLENVVIYFEVMLWMVNIGLLPEHNPKKFHNLDHFWSAPYLIEDLTEYYNKKRAKLQLVAHETFVEKDSLLYIDNLINNKAAEHLRQQWQEDGGSGLYPAPSLQSVLRIYLLHGTDLTFKHSLVTYTLLDIATTVDENNKVIKLLLKFPQIFDLSQSNIKVVQAFWHLDHDDYETALEYILDPCVLAEDLQHWHHSVMMRSLLLQEQFNLALVYLQIRKPSIQDEKDLFTVVSLLVSKNMLDEAFKFKQHYQSINEHALLTHIFNECNKTESLHSLLYRCLNNEEERAFFRYLQSTKNPRCEDLRVFYFLLRSRFLEAFDTYSSIKRTKPENQGLIGQKDATTADNIVRMFKTLLPDVNKNLVDLVRKERTNLWIEVTKPTPLSVFVHNAKDKVQYKSSVIFAALAKAKQTFHTTMNESRVNNEVVTEETPFLRTPTVYKTMSRIETPLIKSKIIEQNELGEEYGPAPCKKLKLSPRVSKITPIKNLNTSNLVHSKLITPIVRRKKFSLEPDASCSTILPQSILKISSRTILDDSILNENTSTNVSAQLQCENSFRRAKLALTPRKPISNTPQKSHVKFDDLCYSSSSAEVSSKNESNLPSPLEVVSNRLSKNSTASTNDDVFFSPDNSFEVSSNKNSKTTHEIVKEMIEKKSLSPVREKLNFDETIITEEVKSKKNDEKVEMYISMAENDLSTNRLTFQSPKSRRSYKRSFSGSPIPIRSSPRLAKKSSLEDSEEAVVSEQNVTVPSIPSSPKAHQRLRGRRSLSRTVLENNAFSSLKLDNIQDNNKETPKSLFVASSNSSYNDSDMDYDPNESIDNFLKKFSMEQVGDSSLNNSTLQEDKGQIISKVIESTSTEIRRESIKLRGTNEPISSKQFKQETHSKTVEVFGDNSHELNTKRDTSRTVFEENVEESDANDTDAISEHGSISNIVTGQEQEKHIETEEINVYEDLSSGSEDVRQVILKNNEDEKVYTDLSYSRSQMFSAADLDPLEIMETDDNNDLFSQKIDDDSENFNEETNIAEKAFVVDDVIEIGSSSDDDDDDDENTSSIDIKTSPHSITSSTENSNSSSESDNEESEEAINRNVQDDEYHSRHVKDGDSLEGEQIGFEHFESSHVEVQESKAQTIVKDLKISISPKAHQDDEHMDTLILTEDIGTEEETVKQLEKLDYQPIVSQDNDEKLKSSKKDNQSENADDVSTVEQDIFNKKVTSDLAVQTTMINKDQTKYDEDIENDVAVEKQSKSLQCTLGLQGNQQEEHVTSENDETLYDESPLILKSVKKTYLSKNKIISETSNLDATPKLTVSMTKRTYSKKDHQTSTSKMTDEDAVLAVDDEKQEPTQISEAVVEKEEHLEETKQEEKHLGSEEKDQEEKMTDAREETLTGPITRRRSMMLQQHDGTSDRASLESSGEFQKSQSSKSEKNSRGSSHSSTSQTPSSRRITRRMSQLSDSVFDSTYVGDSPLKSLEIDIMDTSIFSERTTVKVDRELLEIDVFDDIGASTPANISSKRSFKANIQKSDQSVDSVIKAKKRIRSASVDQHTVTVPRKKTIRSKSIDLDDVTTGKPEKETIFGVKILSSIDETAGTSTKENNENGDMKHISKATSDIGGYTTSRRLTRRQASMLKSIGTVKDVAESLPNLEEMDPIRLLDKANFEGQPDLAEVQAYEPSSPSGSGASAGISRHTRSVSVMSDSHTSSTKRQLKVHQEAVDSPASNIKSRLRRQSVDTASLASEQSDSPSPSKRARKKEAIKQDDEESLTDTKMPKGRGSRSRSSSVSSIKSHISDKTENSMKIRGRRIHSAKSELPEIQEEKSVEDEDAEKKGKRKKKH